MRYEQNHILPQKTGTRVYGIVKGFQKVDLLGLKASGGEKMKKLLSLILSAVTAISLLTAGFGLSANAEAATGGTTGDCKWSLNGTVLTISSNGSTGDYYSCGPLGG